MSASISFNAKTALALAAFTCLTPVASYAAAAVPNTSTLQTQLQNEWTRFGTMLGGNVSSTGTVSLVKDGTHYKATFPAMDVNLADSSVLKINPIVIDATPDASGVLNLVMTLPTTVPQYRGTQKVGTLTMGGQDIKATIQPVNDGLQIQSLNGTLKNIQWADAQNGTLSIGNIILNGKATQTQINAQNMTSVDSQKIKRTIENIVVTQDAPNQYAMRLSDVFGLFASVSSQNENPQNMFKSWGGSVAGASIDLKKLNVYDASGKNTFSVGDVNVQNKVVSAANQLLTLKTLGSLNGIHINSAPAFADVIPETANFVATIRNMPVSYFTIPQNTPEGQMKARAAKAAAGTQVQLDSLDLNSPSGLKATGTGLLTATNMSPTYNTGNITINMTNMAESLTKLQQQMTKGGSNAGPAMMAIMMLQGMGKTTPDKPGQTIYNVEFTADGQVMINGQNMTNLANMAGMGNKAKAAIPTPTTPAAPAITPWKQK